MKDKRELVRVVKTNVGENENGEEIYEISMDLTGKKSGRGAYICKSTECFRTARRKKAFERAFSCVIPPQVYDNMEKELSENE